MHFLVAFSTFATLALQVLISHSIAFTHGASMAVFMLPWSFAGLGIGCLVGLALKHERSLKRLFWVSAVLFSVIAWIYLRMDIEESPAALVIVLFACTGAQLGLTFRLASQKKAADRIYLWDLSGALLGAGFVFFLPFLRIEGAFLFLISAFALLAAFLDRKKSLLARVGGLTIALSAILLLSAQLFDHRFHLTQIVQGDVKPRPSPANPHNNGNKCLRMGECEIIGSLWDLSASVDAMKRRSTGEVSLYYDNSYFTTVYPAPRSGQIFRFVPRVESALVIGTGGGSEIHQLKELGATDITGVDINSATIQLMKGPLSDISQNIYSQAKVFNEDGRTYLARTNQKFDVISIHWVDSETRAGLGNVFHESYLYTREGLSDALDRLSPEGTLLIVKEYPSQKRPELRRVVESLKELLILRGQDPKTNIMLIRSRTRQRFNMKILARMNPFPPGHLDMVKSTIHLQPGQELIFPKHNALDDPGEVVASELRQVLNDPAVSVGDRKSVTDDWPFIYAEPNLGFAWSGLRPLLWALIIGCFGAILWARRETTQIQRGGRWEFRSVLLGSAFLGVCFGLLEVVLFQAFNIFIGIPVVTLVATISGLLIGGMAASWLSPRLRLETIAGLVSLTAIYTYLLVRVLKPTIIAMGIEGKETRAIALFILLLPAGFFPALMFPKVLVRLRTHSESAPVIGLAANFFGCSLGTWAGMQLALLHGFGYVRMLSVSAYVAIAATLFLWARIRTTSFRRGERPEMTNPILATESGSSN